MTSERVELLRGSVLMLILYDVCEEIKLDQLRGSSDARAVNHAFKHPAPEYVRFQRAPIIEPIQPLTLDSGERLEGAIKYYDYGVISVVLQLPFQGDWPDLIRVSHRWLSGSDLEKQANRIVREKMEQAAEALVKPYPEWLTEDYFLFHLHHIASSPLAADLVRDCGSQIAQVVRGENAALSEAEQKEVLQSSISYYPNDLAVLGWHAAFLYDTPAGAQTGIQLVEYANSQLLEYRHYDELLSRELTRAYRSIQVRGGVLRRWNLARKATQLQALALEVGELAERTDNAIKFLSDMFSARLYRLAAFKVGVLDYKLLVDRKLRQADERYRFMIEQFQQTRAFTLELMVVIILVIELVFLFRGKG